MIVSQKLLRELFDNFSPHKKGDKIEYSLWKKTKYLINYGTLFEISFLDNNGLSIVSLSTGEKAEASTYWGSFRSYLKEKLNENEDEEKENDKMKNFNFDFGPVTGNMIRLSPYGLAIKNNEGTYVSYNAATKDIMDVDVMNFSSANMIYKIPVAVSAISVGDMIIHNKVPMYVTKIDGNITAIDIKNAEVKNIIPVKNIFGFNYVTKVVSIIDMTKTDASEDNPFGNMLPWLMMSNNFDDEDEINMNPFMIMAIINGDAGIGEVNPLMLMALSNNNSSMKDMMMVMALSGNFPGMNTKE